MPRQKLPPIKGQPFGSRLSGLPEPKEKKPRYTGMAMSVENMAEELAIGRNVAYQLVQQPGFPAFTIGRRVLVSRKGLQEWIDEQCKNGSESLLAQELSDPVKPL